MKYTLPWLLAAGLGAAATPAMSFDTGHHQDAVMNNMIRAGFHKTGAEIAFVSNWLVDFYAASSLGKSDLDKASEALHFDNLYNSDIVQMYWNNLLYNFAQAVPVITDDSSLSGKDKEIQLLILVGVMLHAIQDFYTHSSWATLVVPSDPRGYATSTYLTLSGVPAGTGIKELYTGVYSDSEKVGYAKPLDSNGNAIFTPSDAAPHGDYFTGENKDSHIRPNWDKAQVFAELETRRFLVYAQAVIEAADDGRWAKMQAVNSDTLSSNQRGDLEDDLRNSFKLSMFIDHNADGHYKGNLSGMLEDTVTSGLGYTVADADSFIVNYFQDGFLKKLTKCLYGGSGCSSRPMTPPAVPAGVLPMALTLTVENVRAGNSSIDTLSQADFFPKFTMNDGFLGIDRVLDGMDTYSSTASDVMIGGQQTAAWSQLWLVDNGDWKTCDSASQYKCVDLKIELYDYDSPDPDDHIDISSQGKNLSLQFRQDGYLTGEGITPGFYNSPSNLASSSGNDGDRATIDFLVKATDLLVP